MILDFLTHYFKAKNAHGIHSPFVFELYTQVYRNFGKEEVFQKIETRRKELKKDQRVIQVTDFGAGSRLNNSDERSIADIASGSLKSPFWSQFFYRIIKHYKYRNILELGTSLGITTSYLSVANPNAQVWTLEGCENTMEIAMESFKQLHLNNISPIPGNIDETLVQTLEQIDNLDFVLFDANHRYEPTLRYFNLCKEKNHENTCFVFDDIYWSKEMKAAWENIKNSPEVSISIDFFYVGLVFFRKGIEKQHFVLK